jgi:hypothetical protein
MAYSTQSKISGQSVVDEYQGPVLKQSYTCDSRKSTADFLTIEPTLPPSQFTKSSCLSEGMSKVNEA